MPTDSDEKLVAEYLGGGKESLDILIGRYIKPIYSHAYRYTHNQQDAEDITQEVFVKVWKHLKRFDKEKSFKTWIFAIAKNACIDFLKKKKTIPFSAFENDDGENVIEETFADPAPLAHACVEQKEIAFMLSSGLSSAIQKLSAPYRAVLAMRYDDLAFAAAREGITRREIPHRGRTFREIAELLGEPLHTIKSRHRRALILLKTFVSRELSRPF